MGTKIILLTLTYTQTDETKSPVTTHEMASQFGATFVPGGFDDYYMPEVVAPSPQRATPQVPKDMQDDLQRLELEASDTEKRQGRQPSLSTFQQQRSYTGSETEEPATSATLNPDGDTTAHKDPRSRGAERIDIMGLGAPSFSPFPKVYGDNVPPADDAKEEILWSARKHVLHSQNVDMQISWARDVLIWVEIAMDATARELADKPRPATPRIEHELRVDSLNIINYLAEQEHPDALYIRSKWLEFGKFGHRVDKREAYSGYKRAAELGNARSEYRMGMLYEQSNDMSKAKEHYYKGMSLKDSAALYRMGMMSLLGQHGDAKDFLGGLELIRAAANSSDEDAPQGSYVYGMLVGRDLPDITIPDGLLPHSLEKAKMYVEKAAYLGFAKAQLKMGQAYELCQLGCEFNPSYSLHYYGLAAKQGVPEAALGVSRWFLFGYEGVFKKNEELAFRYAQEAAAAKLPTGEFAMGYYYEIGIHVSQSISDAWKWYRLAADHGNKDALSRLESLSHDQSLSKKDHETIALTRIKSQHGSQRGKRPERFTQLQTMPALTEETASPISPKNDNTLIPSTSGEPSSAATGLPRFTAQPSAVFKPMPVSDHATFPDPSRTPFVGSERLSVLNIRLDSNSKILVRPNSAAPYPDDDKPVSLNVNRPRSTAPYPDDDVGLPAASRHESGLQSRQGASADRPSRAFGIKPQPSGGSRLIPLSHSTGSLQPPMHPKPPRGRVVSADWERQASPDGDGLSSSGLHLTRKITAGDDIYSRPSTTQPYPEGNVPQNRLQNQQSRHPISSGAEPTREHGPRISSRRGSEMLPPLPPQDARMTTQNHERFSRAPAATSRLERIGSSTSTHQPPRTPTSPSHERSSKPWPGQTIGQTRSVSPSAASRRPFDSNDQPGSVPEHTVTAPSNPVKGPPVKGPATFEDMGIPQGKQEGDCVVM